MRWKLGRGLFTLLVLFLSATAVGGQSKKNPDFPMAQNAPDLKAGASTQIDSNEVIQGIGLAWGLNAIVPIQNGLSQTTAVDGNNGLIYSIGGGLGFGPDVTVNTVLAYNPATDVWSQVAPIPQIPGIRAYDAAVQRNGLIYVFGGYNGAVALNTLWIYDVANDSWSRGRDIPPSGGGLGIATAIVNDRIFIAGGSGGPNSCFEYDPVTDNYAPRASTPIGVVRAHGAGVATEGLAEFHTFGNGINGNVHLIYNVATDTWRIGPGMPLGVTDPAVEVKGTDIYVMGGIPGGGCLQIFAAVAGSWSEGPMMPGPVNNTSGAQVNGELFVIGGFDGAHSIPTNVSLTFGGGVLQGQVTASGGDPINGARVQAVGGLITRGATANNGGNFRLRIPADTYDTTARAFGFLDQLVAGVVVEEAQTTIQNFSLRPQ